MDRQTDDAGIRIRHGHSAHLPYRQYRPADIVPHTDSGHCGLRHTLIRSTRDKAPVYIYLRNRRHGLVYFEYDGRRYVLNPWE